MKRRNLLILNNLIIATLLIIRLMVFGWLLLIIGLFVIMPITVLHIVATNKGFNKYSKLNENEKLILWMSVYSYILFILFQYEMDDRSGYIIIDEFVRKYIIGSYDYVSDFSNISLIISLITGLVIIVADIFILRRIKTLNKEKLLKK